MSQARATFWQRIGAIRTAIADYALQDLPLLPANASRNASVRVIRSGLAVQCFNVLEDFIKARMGEALAEVSNSGVRFSWLPEALREAATLHAVKAVGVQVKRKPRADRILYVQTYGAKIASTQTGALELPDIGFFHVGSNIGGDDLRDALVAFGVQSPWLQLSGLLSRISISALPAEQIFAGLASRRHAAAHDPNTSISESDLVQSIVDATGIAVGYDLLLSRVMRLLSQLSGPALSQPPIFNGHSSIHLRFIRVKGAGFCEIRENGRRSVARHVDWQGLLPAAKARASANNEALVIVSPTSTAECWFC